MTTPLALSISEACASARAGRTVIYEAIRCGALVARKRGRKTLILPDDLRRWVESHPTLKPVASVEVSVAAHVGASQARVQSTD